MKARALAIATFTLAWGQCLDRSSLHSLFALDSREPKPFGVALNFRLSGQSCDQVSARSREGVSQDTSNAAQKKPSQQPRSLLTNTPT